jgi:hypothetical protein
VQIINDTKQCRHCRDWFTGNRFRKAPPHRKRQPQPPRKFRDPNRQALTGLRFICRNCESKAKRLYYASHKTAIRAKARTGNPPGRPLGFRLSRPANFSP